MEKQQKNKDTIDSEIFNFVSQDLNVSFKDITDKMNKFQNSLLIDEYPIQKNQKLFSKILANSPQNNNQFQTKQFLYSIANFDHRQPQAINFEQDRPDDISEKVSVDQSIENSSRNEENFQNKVCPELLKRIHKVKYYWRKTNPSYPFTFMRKEYDQSTDEIIFSEDYSNKKVSPFD